MKHAISLLLSGLCILSACDTLQPGAFSNRGDPESLLTAESEIVTIELKDSASLDLLSDKLAQTLPARATLNCPVTAKTCKKAKGIVTTFEVPTEVKNEGKTVTLIYERVNTSDCDSNYIDNARNNNNMHHPAFGCSLRANTVQMISDKKQFTRPVSTGPMDGEKAAQAMERFHNPPATSSTGGTMTGSLINSAISSQ